MNSESGLYSLPDEVLLNIFSSVPVPVLLNVSETCKRFLSLSTESYKTRSIVDLVIPREKQLDYGKIKKFVLGCASSRQKLWNMSSIVKQEIFKDTIFQQEFFAKCCQLTSATQFEFTTMSANAYAKLNHSFTEIYEDDFTDSESDEDDFDEEEPDRENDRKHLQLIEMIRHSPLLKKLRICRNYKNLDWLGAHVKLSKNMIDTIEIASTKVSKVFLQSVQHLIQILPNLRQVTMTLDYDCVYLKQDNWRVLHETLNAAQGKVVLEIEKFECNFREEFLNAAHYVEVLTLDSPEELAINLKLQRFDQLKTLRLCSVDKHVVSQLTVLLPDTVRSLTLHARANHLLMFRKFLVLRGKQLTTLVLSKELLVESDEESVIEETVISCAIMESVAKHCTSLENFGMDLTSITFLTPKTWENFRTTGSKLQILNLPGLHCSLNSMKHIPELFPNLKSMCFLFLDNRALPSEWFPCQALYENVMKSMKFLVRGKFIFHLEPTPSGNAQFIDLKFTQGWFSHEICEL